VIGFGRVFSAGILLLWWAAAAAQERVQFPSLGENGPSRAPTILDGYLFRPAGGDRRPAVVFLHGCGGLFSRTTGLIESRERAWASELNGRGYAVLMLDSFGPRNHGEMCSQSGFDRELYLKRPGDAYAALFYLQAQPYVRSDRIGVMGWSEGGGAILYAIRTQSLGRPAELPQGDFRAAVVFYPASCNERRQQGWTSTVPLLGLLGAEDVWGAVQGASRRSGGARFQTRNAGLPPAPITGLTAPTRRSTNFRSTELPLALSRSRVPIPPRGKTCSPASPLFSLVSCRTKFPLSPHNPVH
jgi:dienelactone hydrolase